MNKTNFIVLSVIVFTLCIAGAITWYFYTTPNDQQNSEAKKTLSAESGLSFTDLNGNTITFDEHEGKVRIVNMWASWTPFSIQELTDLDAIAADFKDRGVVAIAINRKESKEQAARFLNSMPAFEHIIFALDPEDAYYSSLGGYAMPETIIYDAQGNIVTHKRGPMAKDEMSRMLEEALQPQE